MKRALFLSIFLLIFSSLYSSQLVHEELFFDGGSKRATARKIYLYNEHNDIISVVTYSAKGVEASCRYSYEDGLLTRVDEFHGKELLIKYTIFLYKGVMPVSSTVYDFSGRVTLKRRFLYDGEGRLAAIKDFSPTDEYLGKRGFFYEKGRLVSEVLYNGRGGALITKSFLYEEGQIDSVEFYNKERRIRLVKRLFGEGHGALSLFGFRDNFWDLR